MKDIFDFEAIDDIPAFDDLDYFTPLEPLSDLHTAAHSPETPFDAAQAREAALTPCRPNEPGRLASIYVQPIELASVGLIELWREAARSDLVTQLLPDAIRTLAVVMRDAMASPAARVAAAKTVLGAALADVGTQGVKKALHEMSAAEIEGALVAIRDEMAARSAQPAIVSRVIEHDELFD